MAGSKRYFAYFDDSGNEYYAHLDESTAESTDLGFGQSVTPAVFANLAFRLRVSQTFPLQMRYIIAEQILPDGRIVKRKFRVGATSAPVWGDAVRTATIGGSEWTITAKIGEQRFYPPAQDTGQTDGDIDDNVTTGV